MYTKVSGVRLEVVRVMDSAFTVALVVLRSTTSVF